MTTTTTLRAEGFTCPSCVAKIEGSLAKLPGVDAATVNFASGRIVVTHDPAAAPVDALVADVARAGYTARPSAF